jgi:hypothetical protein
MKQPNLSISKELSYFIGAFLGDGYLSCNMKNQSYLIKIYAGLDKSFAEKCFNCLKTICLNPRMWFYKNKKYMKWKGQWIVYVYSKKLYEYLKNLKIENLKNLLNSKELIYSFIIGFYDAEGCLPYKKYRKNIRLNLHIDNTNLELVNFVKELLFNLGFNPTLVCLIHKKKPNWKPLYRLSLYRQKEITKFLLISSSFF